MKIGTRLIIFVVFLLIVTVASIIAPIYIGSGRILMDSSKRGVAAGVREVEAKITDRFDGSYGDLAAIAEDREVKNLMKIAKFTKKYEQLDKKVEFIKKLLGYDHIDVYDRKGRLAVTSGERKEGELPEFARGMDKGERGRTLMTDGEGLKMLFFAPIHYKNAFLGTIVLTENIDSGFLGCNYGSGKRSFAVYEKEGDGYALRAASDGDGFGGISRMPGGGEFPRVDEGFRMGDKIGVASFTHLAVAGEAADRLLLAYFESTAEMSAIRGQVVAIALIMGAVSLGLGMLLVIFYSRRLSRVLGRLTEFSGAVADGDLTGSLSIRRNDEIGTLCSAQNRMVEKMGALIGRVANASDDLYGASRNLAGISGRMAGESETVSMQVNNTAAASEQLSHNMNSIAAAMEESATAAGEISRASVSMAEALSRLAREGDEAQVITGRAVGEVDEAVKALDVFETEFREINRVVDTIKGISAQTNLLALNAGIQASRNGGDRSGFKVVVQEIKALAAQTADATRIIRDRMEKVHGSARQTADKIGGSVEVITRVNEKVGAIVGGIRSQETMTRGIVDNVTGVAEAVAEVNGNIAEASAVSSDIAKDMVDSGAASEQISSGAATVRENAAMLTRLAGTLTDLVGCFSVRESRMPDAMPAQARTDQKTPAREDAEHLIPLSIRAA